MINTYGEKHPDIANIKTNLGDIYVIFGEFSLAKKHYEEALSQLLSIYGENHPDVGAIYNQLSMVYYRNGDLQTAKNYSLKALKVSKDKYGEKHNYTQNAKANYLFYLSLPITPLTS